MENNKNIRKPQQTRAIITRQKILEASRKLFSEKGFHLTTTNEIAKVSQLSIGTLYSYFRDKDEILIELLTIHNDHFAVIFEQVSATIATFADNPEKWMREFIELLISLHRQTLDFSKELRSLYSTKKEVRTVIDAQTEKNQKMIYELLLQNKELFQIQDLEAFSYVFFDFTNALVDSVVFSENKIAPTRIIDTGIHCLMQMLHIN